MFADGGKKKKKKKKKHHTNNEHEETDQQPQQYGNFKLSIQIEIFIFPEYINRNFIFIGLSPCIMNQLMMKTFSMKLQFVTRKPRKKEET